MGGPDLSASCSRYPPASWGPPRAGPWCFSQLKVDLWQPCRDGGILTRLAPPKSTDPMDSDGVHQALLGDRKRPAP